MPAVLVTRRGALLALAALGTACSEARGDGSPSPSPPSLPAPPPPSGAPSTGPVAPINAASNEGARVEGLERVRERLRPLHERPARPKAGEWRAEHPEERGQTFEQYLRSRPTLPDGARKVLAIQPLGDFTPTQRRIVTLVADYMGRHFRLETRVLPDASLSAVPASARRKHPQWGDKQILTTHVLERVLRPSLPADAAALIAFTASDLWPGGGWNFVFGQADLRARVGVWSIYRNGNPDAGPEAFKLALLRAMRIAVHETGHMFSLEHCTAYRCVQAGVNSLEEADRAPLWLCPECEVKVAWATRSDPKERLRGMGEFCKAQGLEREAAFFARSLATLGS